MGSLFNRQSAPLLGIDISSSSVKLVELGRDKAGSLVLERCAIEPLERGWITDGNIEKFDEVADEIALLVSQGKSLQDAYDTAVWMNPVTRAKEQARLTSEHEAKLKETARLEALPKKRATSVNVKNGDAARTPTEPVGSLEDTIRETHRAIRARPS